MSTDLLHLVVIVLTASKLLLALIVWRTRNPPIHAVWFRDLLLLMAAFDSLYWLSLSRGSPLLLGVGFVFFLAPSSLVFVAAVMSLVSPSAVAGAARRIWLGGALVIGGVFAIKTQAFQLISRHWAESGIAPDLSALTTQSSDITAVVAASFLFYFLFPILILMAALLFRRDRRLLQARFTMLGAQFGIIVFHVLLVDGVPQALGYLFGSIILTPAIFIVLSSTMPEVLLGIDRATRLLPLRTKLGLGFGSLIVILYGVSFFSFYVLYQLGTSVEGTVLIPSRLSTDAAEVQTRFAEARRLEQTMGIQSRTGAAAASFSTSVAAWEEQVNGIDNLLDSLDALALDPAHLRHRDEIEGMLRDYRARSLRIIGAQRIRGELIRRALASSLNDLQPFDLALATTDPNSGLERQIRALRAQQLVYVTTQDPELDAVILQEYTQILQRLDELAGAPGMEGLQDVRQQLAREATVFGGIAGAHQVIAAEEVEQQLVAESIETAIKSFGQSAEAELAAGGRQIDEIRGDYSVALIGIGLSAIVLATLLAQLTSRQISDQALVLTKVANRMAQGDLRTTVPVVTQDEFGQTAQAVNEMAGRLRHTLDTLEERVAHRTSQLDTAAKVAAAVNEERDHVQLLQRTSRLLIERYREFSHVQIYLMPESAGTDSWAYLAAATGDAGERLMREGYHVRVGDASIVGRALESGTPQLARLTELTVSPRPQSSLPGSRAEIALPLLRDGTVIGVLDVQSERPGGLTQEHLTLLQTLADQLAVGVQNARLFERTQQSLSASQRLFEASRAIGQAATVEGILQAVCDHLAPDDTRDILLYELHLDDVERQSGHLKIVATGLPDTLAAAPADRCIPFVMPPPLTPASLSGMIDPYVVSDIGQDPNVRPGNRAIYRRMDIHATVSVPIGLIDGTMMVLQFALRKPGEVPKQDLDRMAGIGSQVSTALQKLKLLESLERRAQRLAGANKLAATLLSSNSLDVMFEVAAEEICHLLAVDQVGVVLFEPERRNGLVVSQYRRGSEPPALGARIPITPNGNIQWMIDHRAPVISPDVTAEPLLAETLELLQHQGIESVLFIPMIVRGEVIGSLGLDMIDRKRDWQPVDVSLAQNVSNLLASAIESNRLFGEVRASLEQTRSLYESSRAITEAQSAGEIAAAIRENMLPGQSASVCLISLETDDLGVTFAHIEGAALAGGKRFSRSRPRFSASLLPAVRKLQIGRHPLLIPDTEEEPALTLVERRLLKRLRIRALMGVPMHIAGGGRGLILVSYPEPRRLQASDIDRLGALATQTATKLQNQRLLQQTRDSLTESQLLYQAGTHLNEAESYEDVLRVLVPLVEPLDLDQIVLCLFDRQITRGEKPSELICATSLLLGEPIIPSGHRHSVSEMPFLADLEGGRDIRIARVGHEESLGPVGQSGLESVGVGSLLGIQLRIGIRYMGWILFLSRRPQQFPDEVIRMLRNIAQPTAIALEGQRLLGEAQRRAWREKQIARITGRLYTTTDPREIMQIGLTELQQVLGARRVAGWVDSDAGASPSNGHPEIDD